MWYKSQNIEERIYIMPFLIAGATVAALMWFNSPKAS